jgi:hypothetical protein
LDDFCFDWAKYHKNCSVLFADVIAEEMYAIGDFVGESSESLIRVCRLDDGVVFSTGLTMIILHGDPLMKRFREIVDRVFEAGPYNYWNSQGMYRLK